MALSMENTSWEIFGDGCIGPNCMDVAVARVKYPHIHVGNRSVSMYQIVTTNLYPSSQLTWLLGNDQECNNTHY
jgi:hypothetical protein